MPKLSSDRPTIPHPFGCKDLVMFYFSNADFFSFSELSITNISINSAKNDHLYLLQTVLCVSSKPCSLKNKWRGLRVRQHCWCAEVAACHDEQCWVISFVAQCLPLSLMSYFALGLSLRQTERLNVFVCIIPPNWELEHTVAVDKMNPLQYIKRESKQE